MQPITQLQIPGAISTPDVVTVAKAVGDELRANVLRGLGHDSFGVGELCRVFDTSQPAMSHHLRILREAELVTQRREGTTIFYQRALPSSDLTRSLFEALDASPLQPGFAAGIETVHQARADLSRSFFDRNEDALAQQNELICEPQVYAKTVLDITTAHFPRPTDSALEVGPGSGVLLHTLAPWFAHLTAIDNSAQMLEETRAATATLNNVDLLQCDFADLPRAPRYDLVVAGMVIHHMPSPARFFHHASGLLKPGGLLIAAELCSHSQDWARQMCGDIWLGFETEELDHWARQAGFNSAHQQFLAQRNGFRVQVNAYALP